jgi:hypothetical protein
LFNDLYNKTTNSCGTARPNQKEMLQDFGKKLKMKLGDIQTRMRGDLTAIVGRTKGM